MSPEDQLNLWVQGVSVHNAERDECCPDFSCCRPEMRVASDIRKAFALANEDERLEYLMMFLGGTLVGQKCYLTNGQHKEV